MPEEPAPAVATTAGRIAAIRPSLPRRSQGTGTGRAAEHGTLTAGAPEHSTHTAGFVREGPRARRGMRRGGEVASDGAKVREVLTDSIPACFSSFPSAKEDPPRAA